MARPAIHPGEMLAEELDELGVSAAELGRQLHVPTNRITQILNGQRAISADSALRLGQWFGTGPELWLDLRRCAAPGRLGLARLREHLPIAAARASG